MTQQQKMSLIYHVNCMVQAAADTGDSDIAWLATDFRKTMLSQIRQTEAADPESGTTPDCGKQLAMFGGGVELSIF